jgi:hypothetical protein
MVQYLNNMIHGPNLSSTSGEPEFVAQKVFEFTASPSTFYLSNYKELFHLWNWLVYINLKSENTERKIAQSSNRKQLLPLSSYPFQLPAADTHTEPDNDNREIFISLYSQGGAVPLN